MIDPVTSTDQAVRERYGAAARRPAGELCCAVEFDKSLLGAIPAEVLERDYGCGDPTRYARPGETVLDLGSGSGKACFITAQIVGPAGRVIGIDMTAEMLELSRRNAPLVARNLGYANVEFRRGRIQDLALDLDLLEGRLAERPVAGVEEFLAAHRYADELRRDRPMIPTGSVDLVVSNCVLNLVDPSQKRHAFDEMFRVLRRGGRAVIADIVSDRPVPDAMTKDPDLWSGCISGALTEEGFLQAFEESGFHGMRILDRQDGPWRVVEGIEFRSVTVEAFTGKQGPCPDQGQSVIYRGPFKEALDDDGHRYERGKRVRVCKKTYDLMRAEPYVEHFYPVDPSGAEAGDAPSTCGPKCC